LNDPSIGLPPLNDEIIRFTMVSNIGFPVAIDAAGAKPLFASFLARSIGENEGYPYGKFTPGGMSKFIPPEP
jgi:hypothetical protein